MPEAALQSFAPYHKWDRTFFLAFAALAWIAVVKGFSPEVGGHLKGLTPYPPLIVHLHVLAFGGWLVLFTAQIWLIRSGRADIHRKLGLAAVALVPVMVVLGVATTLVSRRLHFEAGENQMLAFMIVPLTDMVLFPSFAIPGLLWRRNSPAHKRLILLATTMLLPAAYGRWIGPWIIVHIGDGFFGFMAQSYLGPDVLILAAMAYDRLTRGRVHPVYLIAAPWILAVQAITSAIYHWSGWMPLAQRMIGH
ncbi:MAG: hypothetical protein H0U98_00650 [Alphaproteobacteria bacterium]|nr:hypothetical protein [Alphaproteobacteria bacterium]